MDDYDIPEYIWKPIMLTESNGNPYTSVANANEVSKGLFQINVKAHPQYADLDLFDPVVNAGIAARNFILPAYLQAKRITSDKKQQALISYSGLKNPDNPSEGYLSGNAGIRPSWTDNTKNRFLKNYASTADTDISPPSPALQEKLTQQEINDKIKLSTTQSIAKFFIIIGIIIVMVFAVFQLITSNSLTDSIKLLGKVVK
jgi:hypothetical protein